FVTGWGSGAGSRPPRPRSVERAVPVDGGDGTGRTARGRTDEVRRSRTAADPGRQRWAGTARADTETGARDAVDRPEPAGVRRHAHHGAVGGEAAAPGPQDRADPRVPAPPGAAGPGERAGDRNVPRRVPRPPRPRRAGPLGIRRGGRRRGGGGPAR